MKKMVFLITGLILAIIVDGQNTVLTVDRDISLIPLRDSIFIHLTWENDESYGRYSSNGLIVIRAGRALMIDTPADDAKTERLCKWLKDSFSVRVSRVVVCHFHDDCLGGLGYLHKTGVVSAANWLTAEYCRELQLPVPMILFNHVLNFDFNGEPVECRYFGSGHSPDNITVWLPEQKILFGGCLIKSAESAGLGNLSDAEPDEWDETVRKLIAAYSSIGIVIPGHGNAGGPELLEHTIRLVEAYKNR